MRAFIKDVLTGFEFPEPSSYKGTVETDVDGGRNTDGQWLGSVIISGLGRVDASWSALTGEQWSNILKLFEESYGGSFTRKIEFLDQVSNTWVTREMYVTNRTASMFRRKPDGTIIWTDCSFGLVDTGKR